MKLERDALTRLTYLQLGCYGYFLYGLGPTLSLLRDEQDVSRSVAGLHGTALAVGSLVSALAVAPLTRRYGRTAVVWTGLAGLCLGVLAYVASTALPATLVGVVVAAFGGSFVVVSSAPVLSDRHGDSGPSAISEANAVAAGVGTIAPLVVGASVGLGFGWRPALLLVVPVVLVLAVAGRRVRAPRPAPAAHHAERGGRLPRRYWVSWGVLTAGSRWSSASCCGPRTCSGSGWVWRRPRPRRGSPRWWPACAPGGSPAGASPFASRWTRCCTPRS